MTTIASDDILKYKNLYGHPFEILLKEEEGNIAVTLTLGNKLVKGCIPNEFYRKYIENDRIYFGISSSNRNGYFSLVLTGIEKMNTMSFPQEWFYKGQILVPDGSAYRLPIPDVKAGHILISWKDQENNDLLPGTRCLSTKSVAFAANAVYPGDIDCNGQKEAADLVLYTRYMIGEIKELAATADSNCDGVTNLMDFVRLKKMISE